MATRYEARQIAADHLKGQGHPAIVRTVLASDEITARRPAVYMARPFRWEDCWICFLAPDTGALASSQIVVVSRGTGEVVYAGPAGDEG